MIHNRFNFVSLITTLIVLLAACGQQIAPQAKAPTPEEPTQNRQALVWQLQTLDSAGRVGEDPSLALDSSGNPVISYFDFSNDDLKLVHCGNATCTSGNSIQTVDSAGNVGEFSSLALDSSGNPVISYYDLTNDDLKLAHCGNATCTSGNTIQTVDSAVGVGEYTSLVLDSSGNPVISYFDGDNQDLKLAHCGNATCTSGNSIVSVDSAGFVGQYTSLALDSSGNPVISYLDRTNFDLKLVHCGNATCTSGNTVVSVDSGGNVGFDTSLALDSSGNPVISYYDATNRDLKLVHCGNATCTSGNTVVSVDSAGSVGPYTSLALDSSGNPVISYRDFTNFDLKLAHCGNATCTSGNTIQTVDSAGDVGFDTSLALDSSGNPVISYFDNTNGDLKLARLVNDDTTPPSITLTTPSDGAKYLLGQSINASYSCSDDTAVASCVGTVASGAAINTASVGSKSFKVDAADTAGNTASKTVTYQVIYNFRGFFQPVDSLPTLNQVKAGQSIPIKFSLSGNQGLAIFAAGSPSSQSIFCSSSTTVDDIEQTVSVGNSSLQYDATSNTYTYVWKTEKGWSGSCRQLILTLSDGMSYRANFKFK